MKLDIPTLAYISSLTFLVQCIALFIQYSINKSSRAVRWWLLGSAFWAAGVILMPLVMIESLRIYALFSNPLTISGIIFLYSGILEFLNQKEKRWGRHSLFVGFLVFYYYFMFIDNEISGRTFVLTATFAIISTMAAFRLLFVSDKLISGSARFTGSIFLMYGLFSAFRAGWVLFSPPIQTYTDQGYILSLSFIIPTIASLLWTFGFIIMINQRLNAEYREEKEKLQLIFDTSPDSVLISQLSDGSIVEFNASFLGMTGYSRDELLGNSTLRINVWRDPEDREKFIEELKRNGSCENREFDFQRKNGSILTGSISAKIIPIHSIPHIISVVHDITRNKQNEVALRESEELYRSILNASPDDITITDLNGAILVISPAAKKMFGYEPEYNNFIGTPLVNYIIPADHARAQANIIRMRKGDYAGPNEYQAIRKDGSLFDIEVNSGLIFDANRQPAKMVFIVRDITERKQAEQKINQLVLQLEFEKKSAQLDANTDSLTGLANRRFFDDTLASEFIKAKKSGHLLSVIMLDVDHFKKYNDHYGHLAGDDCLRQIGMTLKSFIRRTTDTVARYGGEEFVIILTDNDQQGAETLAERIRKAIFALAIPHAASDISKCITVSLGVITVNPASFSTPEQIVSLADEAMYRAKKGGRNQIFSTIETENLSLGW